MNNLKNCLLVKAISYFNSENEDELNLKINDVVQVIKKLDKFWYYGIRNNKEGKFPINKVVEVDIRHKLLNAIGVFVCKENFIKQKYNYLTLNENDIIIAIKKINFEEFEGKLLNSSVIGLFSTHFTWQVKDMNDFQFKFSNIFAEVLYDMSAQLENEISLKKGDIVKINKEHDEMYFSGELNGQKGIFPKNFVSIIQKPSTKIFNIYKNDTDFENDNLPTYESATNYINSQTEVFPYGRSLYSFKAENEDELSFEENQIIKLNKYINAEWIEGELDGKIGIFPKNYIEIIVDCVNDQTYNQENYYDLYENEDNLCENNVEVEDFPLGTVGIVLFDFKAQMDGDLSIKKDEKINLMRKFNNDWVEVFNGLELGICPLNYIKILSNTEEVTYTLNKLQSDNLIEFSPEKKNETATIEKHKVNYDALIELDVERHKSKTVEPVDFSFKINYSSIQEPVSVTETKTPIIASRPKPSDNLKNKKKTCESSFSQNLFDSEIVIKENKFTDNIEKNNVESLNLKISNKQLTKMMQQRECIVTELLQSERDYNYALTVCYDAFKKEKTIEALKEKKIDFNDLFLNLKQIIDVSQKLISLLSIESNKECESQIIGKCFSNISTNIETSYLSYCNTYNNIQTCFEKCEKDETDKIFQKCFMEIYSKTNCFDIPSILIKPVQRILRYPLLLNELIRCTSESHLDYEYLQNALKMITDLAKNINEYKRRKDLVFKYRRENIRQNSFSTKLSKINLHTLKKKYSRLNYKLTSTIGLNHKNKDSEFDFELNRFRFLEKSIKIFLKNLKQFLDNLEIYLKTMCTLNKDIFMFYGEKNIQPLVEKSKSCHEIILNEAFEKMRNDIQANVIDILRNLLIKFQNPEKLINKRHDKLIDYKTATKNSELIKDLAKLKYTKEQLDISKDVYEALNQQLIDDLPIFTSNGIQIYENCIFALITIYKRFIGKAVEQMLSLIMLPPIEINSIKCSNDILETFQIKHNLIAQKLTNDFLLIPNNIFPQVVNNTTLATAVLDKQKLLRNSKILNNAGNLKSKKSFQTPENRISLLSDPKIDPNNLYIVTSDYDPIDVLDLKALKDDIVVVIKRKDPTGLESRWYVDNGSNNGFLPKKILVQKNLQTFEVNNFCSNSDFNRNSSIMYSVNSNNFDLNSIANSKINSEIQDLTCKNKKNIYEYINDQNLLDIDDFDPLKQNKIFDVDETYDINNDPKIDDINLRREEPPCNEYYRAAHPFKEIGPKQLSLELNEIVVVKYKCDLYKSPEWWYVENEQGKCGYVPGNRLSEK